MAVKQIRLQAPTLFADGSKTTIFFILTIIITSPWPASPLSFNYPVFNDSIVNRTGDATIDPSSNSVQITKISAYGSRQLSAGWVTNSKPMHLWDSKRLTDFTTEFTFQIYAADNYYGDGMTFFLADPRLKFNKSLANQANLGIPLGPDTNKTLNSSKYQFVAVEFDTFPNEGIDPDYHHVGIDINSVNSSKTTPWNMNISDENKNYYARIDYDSSTHNLSVAFNGSMTQESLQYLWYQVDLRSLPESVIVGFSASTGGNTEMHNLISWSLSSTLPDESALSPTPTVTTSPQPPPKKGSKIGLWFGLAIGLCLFFGFIGCVWFLRSKKKASKEEQFVFYPNLDEEFEKGTGPKRFPYSELVSATNNFAEVEKLGQGGFGGVYRGFLKDSNSFVAIKRVSRGSEQGIKEYATEVKVISH